MSERYIVIPKWEEFQHYKDRDPVWLKVYTRLQSDDGFRELTFHQRGVLVSMWIEYARSGRQLRDNTLTLTRQLGGRVSRRDIEALTYAGFLTFSASAPLAQSKSKRREEKNSKDVSSARDETAEIQNTKNGKSKSALTEAEVVAERERREQSGYVDNIGQYTGCRLVRGEMSIHGVYDPLGTEYPPEGWPYPRPTRLEIVEALRDRDKAVA